MIELSVIIVLYNEFDLVKKCLSSVFGNRVKQMEIILVDNSSDKTGHKGLLNKYPEIKYIQNNKNLGFGGASNVGIKNAKGKYILILTPDMFLMPKTIEGTLSYIKLNPKVGVVGCRVFSSSGKLQLSASFNYPNIYTNFYYYNMPFYKLINAFIKNYIPYYFNIKKHKEIISTKRISGAYMLFRKEALISVKSFDLRFFLYFEDVDLFKKVYEKGWEVVYLPFGGVVQNGVSKWKKTEITQAMPQFMQSEYLFFKKHYGNIYAIFAWIVGFFSALFSIPYFLIVFSYKKIMNKHSQSKELLPLWFGIIKWHLFEGFILVFNI